MRKHSILCIFGQIACSAGLVFKLGKILKTLVYSSQLMNSIPTAEISSVSVSS